MKALPFTLFVFAGLLLATRSCLAATELPAALQGKVDKMVQAAKTLAADPAIVAAVRTRNASVPPQYRSMTQEQWDELSVLDPLVRDLSKNDAARALKAKRTDDISEIFLSAADGTKVALLSKSSNWSHGSSAKHKKPMEGATWQGDIEVDDSTGLQQLQISVPVLDDETPIGSLIVGLRLSRLQ